MCTRRPQTCRGFPEKARVLVIYFLSGGFVSLTYTLKSKNAVM